MDYTLDAAGRRRLDDYFATVGNALNNKKRREAFASYALGLFSDLDRKSVEPIAAAVCPSVEEVGGTHQRLLHFVGQAAWDDCAVREVAAKYGLEALAEREDIDAWIVDDTGFLKQGTHSVGVQRQYTGSAGKVANCQLGVSLALATPSTQLPVDFELYLPRSWTDDEGRRQEGRIPTDVGFRTKPELAIDMIKRAVAAGYPPAVVLADSAYGNSSVFRAELRQLNLDYAVAVQPSTKVWRLDAGDARRGPATSIHAIAQRLPFRRTTWRDGTKTVLTSRFAACRVKVHREDTKETTPEPLWLLVEWPHDEEAPTKFFLLTLAPSATRKQLVRTVKERWRTERAYQDMKGELGLDHYEGRRFRGWHHHVTVVLCCYAFMVAELARHFPPSRPWTRADPAHFSAARAAFR